ncbi:1-acyl-sn-glycerol-3-phosphate acyltransferase [Capnocytophaga gingivalis]|nr:1-acyl-sn-glycerol-3-phosphate acyltransferase [Capnocytophaga gingivalis]MEB3015186.1 1-acyl-sn-glycerol-3-phosphate acyltransferase [Capnocytophaga gingivalis]
MKKWIGAFFLWITGWKVVLEGEDKVLNRCVLVVAPHTSNWEFVLGILAYWKLDKPIKLIIKDAHTKAWYGWLVRKLGGIGINRSQRNHLVEFVTEQFKKEDFSLVVTPEGTRSRVDKWRMGFYHMALTAQVPIVLGAGDFKKKTIFIGKTIPFTDLQTRSKESIIDEIREYYRDKNPKYPQQWNPDFSC